MKVYEAHRVTIELEITKDLDKIISALKLKAYDYYTEPDDREFYFNLIKELNDANPKKDIVIFFT